MASRRLTEEERRRAQVFARFTYAGVMIAFLTICAVAVITTMNAEKNKKGFQGIRVSQPARRFHAQRTRDHRCAQGMRAGEVSWASHRGNDPACDVAGGRADRPLRVGRAQTSASVPRMAGGGFRHGQHLAFDPKDAKRPPLTNLFVSMLQEFGVQDDRFATSTGTSTSCLRHSARVAADRAYLTYLLRSSAFCSGRVRWTML